MALACIYKQIVKPGTSSNPRSNPWENRPSKMADEMHSKQHKFRGFPEFPGPSCIVIATAKEIAICNDKLAPETELRSVIFFSA